jgi:hypothetical protein
MFSIFSVQADESRLKKVYVSSEQIKVRPEGIFCCDPAGGMYPVTSVSVDAAGIYVMSDSFEATFQCPGCDTRYADDGMSPIYCRRLGCLFNGKRIK